MLQSDALILERSYAAYRSGLVRRLTAMTRQPEVAEDLAQEAFLRLAREVEAGRLPNDVPAWLHRVGANLVASRGRHLKVVERKDAEMPQPGIVADPESEVVRSELTAALRLALDGLPPVDRDALLLAARGYSGPDIARLISRSPGATRTLLCRARARLRERMTLGGFAPAA